MVIDLAKPARIDKAFVLESNNGQPARLVLDLTAIDRDSFPARDRARKPRAGLRLQACRPGSGDAGRKGRSAAAGRARSRPWRHRQRHPGRERRDSKRTIVLEFSLMLREQIEKIGKYRVVMTRTDDTFVPLAERVNLARGAAGLAVHLDPCRRAGARRRRCAGRDDLHPVGNRLGRRRRAARRGREPGRRDRRGSISRRSPTTSPTS